MREPCEFTRSPTIVGRGSCTSGPAEIMDEIHGKGLRSSQFGLKGFFFTRSLIARMWSGVVPQQPPTIATP